MEQAQVKSKFQLWYERNDKKLNRKRRKRYRSDVPYREKQLKTTKRWRERTREARAKAKPPRTHFTIGEAAERIGCYTKTIQNLERAGMLPSMTDGTRHRKYTAAQIELMKALVMYRKETHYKTKGYDRTIKSLVAVIKKKWRKVGQSGDKRSTK